MTQSARWLDTLCETLEGMRVEVNVDGDDIEVSSGRGLTASSAQIDPEPLFDELDEADSQQEDRLIAGYASGVKHVLLEPARSEASQWSFQEAAGRLVPTLQVYTFEMGVRAAAGDQPWTTDFFEDLVAAYLLDLDVGMRVLTGGQFDKWQVTADRVRAAARSMLYHKSRNAKPQALDDFDEVELIRVGDGYDAMRAIVVSDVFFSEFEDDFHFAIPTNDAFLFVRGEDEDRLASLRSAADALFGEANYPLTRSIYSFEVGKPTLVEER